MRFRLKRREQGQHVCTQDLWGPLIQCQLSRADKGAVFCGA